MGLEAESQREHGGGEKKKRHGQFLMEMDEAASEDSWSWLRAGYLKKETEVLLVAVQIQTVRTRKTVPPDEPNGQSYCE